MDGHATQSPIDGPEKGRREAIPFLDLRPALEPLLPAIQSAMDRVLQSCLFLRGPETEAFEQEWAACCGQRWR